MAGLSIALPYRIRERFFSLFGICMCCYFYLPNRLDSIVGYVIISYLPNMLDSILGYVIIFACQAGLLVWRVTLWTSGDTAIALDKNQH